MKQRSLRERGSWFPSDGQARPRVASLTQPLVRDCLSVLLLVLPTVSSAAESPVVSGVRPNPVHALNAPQEFVVYGKGFATNCTVTLRDKGAGQVFRNRRILARTQSELKLRVEFTATPSEWSVEVINPPSASSGEFAFQVVATKLSPIITSVIPTPVPAKDGNQFVLIRGINFVGGCTVKLRDTRTGEPPWVFRPEGDSLTPEELVVLRNFTATPASWSVEIINPSGDSSGEFQFLVVDPLKMGRARFYQNQWFRGSAVAATLLGLFGWFHRRSRKQEEAHKGALQAMRKAEREDFYRELHDGVSSEIGKVENLIEKAKVLTEAPRPGESVEAELAKASAAILSARNNVDDLRWAFGIHSDNLKNLLARIRTRARDLLEPVGIKFDPELPTTDTDRAVTAEFSKHVLLTVTEALNNVVKHADAKIVKLVVAVEQHNLRVAIKDDGRGLPDLANAKAGRGMENMRRRIEDDLKGRFEVASAQGGTQLTISIPLPEHPSIPPQG